MDLFEMDLGEFGAEGFSLRERADFTGHESGKVDPHENVDLLRGDDILRRCNDGEWRADFRDLTHNQFPGFNGMQNP